MLEQLYKVTPLEDSFGINNVALVDGQPRTLGLRELLRVWVDHRIDVVRRRSEHRLAKRKERLHLVEGLLLAIVDIDEVIQVIRSSDDADTARTRLREVFDLSEPQAEYILELRLRRLTKFSRLELEKEQDALRLEIAQLEEILGDKAKLHGIVSAEMKEVAKVYGTPRRTILLESAGASPTSGQGSSGPSRPCRSRSRTRPPGLSCPRRASSPARATPPSRAPADGATRTTLRGTVLASVRSDVGLVTSRGRIVRVSVLDLPTLPPTDGAPSLSGGVPLSEIVSLEPGEEPLTIVSLDPDAPTLALGTAGGVVKRLIAGDMPTNRDAWEVITLKEGDSVVGAAPVTDEDELVFVSSDANLLHFDASLVRPQVAARRHGGHQDRRGPAGHVLRRDRGGEPGPDGGRHRRRLVRRPARHAGRVRQGHALRALPGQGRATGGVRAQRFLKGEDSLIFAWVGRGRTGRRVGRSARRPPTLRRAP
ncbi:DNA gyrase subunit A [Oerskovia sp. M15]